MSWEKEQITPVREWKRREVKAWPVGQVIHQPLMASALCCHDEWPLSKREMTQSLTTRQWHRQRRPFRTCQSRSEGSLRVLCVLNVSVKGLCVCSGWLLISSSKMTWRSEAVSLYCGSQVVTRSCLGLLCLVGFSFLSSLVIALESIQAQTLWNQFNVRPVLGEK